MSKTPTDIRVASHGSLFLFTATTTIGREWIDSNIPDDAQWLGSSLASERSSEGAVEPRYALDLAQGMLNDGLFVE